MITFCHKAVIVLMGSTLARLLDAQLNSQIPQLAIRDFARRAAVEQPSLEPAIEEIAELYLSLRYAGASGKARARRLRDLVRAL